MTKNRTERYSHKKTGDALDAQARTFQDRIVRLEKEIVTLRTERDHLQAQLSTVKPGCPTCNGTGMVLERCPRCGGEG